ncbi:MAG: LuxR C-terminal-related transcriptional regulator [Acidimicrobiia bacterium]
MAQLGWPIIGRDDLVGQVAAALRRPGAVVALHGQLGSGRTTVAQIVTGGPAARGLDVEWLPASGTTAEDLARLARPEAERSLLVVADDLDQADAACWDDLQGLVESGGARLLATTLALDDRWAGRAVAVAVPGLDRDQTRDLIEATAGRPPAPDLLHAAWERSRGLPLLVRDFLAAARGSGALVASGSLLHFDPDLFHADLAVALPGGPGSPEAGPDPGLLAVVALAEPLPADLAVEAGGRAALDEALAIRLLQVLTINGEDHVRFANPLHGDRVRARLSALEARRAVAELNDALARSGRRTAVDVVRMARWMVKAGMELDPPAALEAVQAAVSNADLDLAHHLARSAWARAPGVEQALALGIVSGYLGELAEADEVLRYAEAHAVDPFQRAEVVIHRLPVLGLEPAEALAAISAALDAVPDPVRRRIYAVRGGWTALTLGFPVLAGELAASALAGAEAPADRDEARLLAVGARVVAGDLVGLDADLDALSLDRPEGRPTGWSNWVPLAETLRALVRVLQGDWRRGLELAEHEYAGGRSDVALEVRAWASFTCGQACLGAGRLPEAASWFGMSLGIPAARALRERLAGFGQYEAASLLGDDRTVLRVAHLLARMPAGAEHVLAGRRARLELALARAEHRDVDAAVDALRAAADELARHGLGVLELEARHELAVAGALVPADVDAVERLAARAGGPLGESVAAFARASLAGEAADLEAQVRRLADLGLDLVAAPAAARAAAVAAAGGQWELAGRVARLGRELARRAGVPGQGPCAVELLRLTARERRIAWLAAQRRPAKEIAEALGISLRTVQNTLGKAYAKLGISSRDELGGLFDLEPSAAGAPGANGG